MGLYFTSPETFKENFQKKLNTKILNFYYQNSQISVKEVKKYSHSVKKTQECKSRENSHKVTN